MYRILSFDGGGIRGLVTLAIIKRLELKIPNLVRNTDLIAGTSTGGIIALGLAAGKSVDEMISLYQNNGEDIFDESWLDDIRDLGGLTGADYDQKSLGKLLKGIFADTKLKDLQKRVLIPTFDLDNGATDASKRTWSPKFFHNFPGPDSDGEELVVDVALNTSAAPTYFPSHGVFIDGGVVANNPSMAAVAQTQDPRNQEVAPNLNDIYVLSIGTGTNLSYIKGKNLDWGLAQWAKPLVGLLLDASMGIADFQARHLFKGTYQRIAPVFHSGTTIIQEFQSIASEDEMAAAWGSHRELLVEKLIGDRFGAARSLLKMFQSAIGIKNEIIVYQRLFLNREWKEDRNSYRAHAVLMNMAYKFFEDFTELGIRLNIDSCWEDINVDYECVSIMFYHILDNARKYALAGRPIDVSFEQEGDSLWVRFKMTSVAVDPDEVDRIYDEGYSGRNAVKLGKQGRGIGMTIVREIARRTGIKFEARWSVAALRMPVEGVDYTQNQLSVCVPRTVKPGAKGIS